MRLPLSEASAEEAMLKIMGDTGLPKTIRLFVYNDNFSHACFCVRDWNLVEEWEVSVVLDKDWVDEPEDWMLEVSDRSGIREYNCNGEIT